MNKIYIRHKIVIRVFQDNSFNLLDFNFYSHQKYMSATFHSSFLTLSNHIYQFTKSIFKYFIDIKCI